MQAALTSNGVLGLFGGTFDPVHRAHLALAGAALAQLALESVRWIPSGQPGHRGVPGAPVADRLRMLELALAGEPRYALDPADALAAEPTYTINTLRRLRAELGDARPLVVLIGMDQLIGLSTWRDWQGLFALAHFGVAERAGEDAARIPPEVRAELQARQAHASALATRPGGTIVRFAMPPMAVSASLVRTRIAARQPVGDLLPPAVLDYIHSKQLYE